MCTCVHVTDLRSCSTYQARPPTVPPRAVLPKVWEVEGKKKSWNWWEGKFRLASWNTDLFPRDLPRDGGGGGCKSRFFAWRVNFNRPIKCLAGKILEAAGKLLLAGSTLGSAGLSHLKGAVHHNLHHKKFRTIDTHQKLLVNIYGYDFLNSSVFNFSVNTHNDGAILILRLFHA